MGILDTKNTRNIRSNGNGWVFCKQILHATTSQVEEMVKIAESISGSLNLGIGCVDLMLLESGNVKMIEANTSMGVESPTTLAELAVSILDLCDIKISITDVGLAALSSISLDQSIVR
jgi:D-alanine-D-alanine ligase-like ATP-grasp enzyme